MNTQQKTPHQLRRGDIVRLAGGRFEITQEPRESCAHRPEGYWPQAGIGPSDCVYAIGICIEGEVRGYFRPGNEWSFQGNHRALFTVEASAA